MATVTSTIDTITKWAKDEICSKIILKLAPLEDGDTGEYSYKTANPECFSLFVPSKEKIPPKVISPFPSLCVRILEGGDDLTTGTGLIEIELCLSTWSTGTFGRDILIRSKENPDIFKEWRGEEAEKYFKQDLEGYRDAWNWVDIALRAIESSASINGIELDRTAKVKYGPFMEQEKIPDLYPYWFAWVRFTVKRPLIRNISEYNGLL